MTVCQDKTKLQAFEAARSCGQPKNTDKNKYLEKSPRILMMHTFSLTTILHCIARMCAFSMVNKLCL
jgi:hypothetical protein